MAEEFNMIVIGAGPAGQAAAKKAAFFGRKVALVDEQAGNLTAHSRIRKVMFQIYGLRDGGFLNCIFDSIQGDGEKEIAQDELAYAHHRIYSAFVSTEHDEEAEKTAMVAQTKMRNLTFIQGRAKFLNLDEIEVIGNSGKKTLQGNNILIATGSNNFKPTEILFDDFCIHSPDSIFNLPAIPSTIAIYGVGVACAQYAIAFAIMGSKVTWLFPEADPLPKMDFEIETHVIKGLENLGIKIKKNSNVVEAFRTGQGEELGVKLNIADGGEMGVDMFLHAAQRNGNTADLGCYEAGIERDDFGFVKVDEKLRTNIDHIYAAGDVVSSPLLESVRKHQGHTATSNILGLEDTEQLSESYPTGIYLLPEAGAYGYTEADAKQYNIKYVIGRCEYADTPYGRNADEKEGFLKLLVNIDTEEIIGVHVVGRFAHEVAHFGILLVETKVPVGKVTGTVLNGSTVHELYHYAAVDAWTKLRTKT